MEAKVRDTYFPTQRNSTVMAFTGREFIKREWRPVPLTHHDEARRGHPMLEFRDTEETTDNRTNDEVPATASARALADENGILLREITARGNKIVKAEVMTAIRRRA